MQRAAGKSLPMLGMPPRNVHAALATKPQDKAPPAAPFCRIPRRSRSSALTGECRARPLYPLAPLTVGTNDSWGSSGSDRWHVAGSDRRPKLLPRQWVRGYRAGLTSWPLRSAAISGELTLKSGSSPFPTKR